MGKKKKKFVPVIVVSSIGLVLGGLIYLGISAFPELLEEEDGLEVKEEIEAAPVETHTIIAEEKIEEEQPSEVNAVSFGGFAESISSFFNGDGFFFNISANDEVNETEAVNDIVISDSVILGFIPSFTDEIVSEDLVEEVYDEPTLVVDEPVVVEDSFLYDSSISEADTSLKTVRVNKRVNKTNNKTTRSNEAVVETSLLVIGAVDVLSMILIKSKKNIFR